MQRSLRSPLAIALTSRLALPTGCGSDGDPQPVAVQEVIEDDADVLLTSCEAPIAGAPIAEEHNKLNFTLCSSEPGYGPPYTGRLSLRANRSEAATRAFLWQRGIRHPFQLRDTSILLGRVDQLGFQETWEHLGGKLAGQTDFKNEDLPITTPSLFDDTFWLKASPTRRMCT